MEMVVGAASWLVGKVLKKLSDELVAAYVASSELGLNVEQIRTDLTYTQALLHVAQGRDDNPGLKELLQQLSKKADEAEDALDELHYFIIQDKLDGTRHATPDLGKVQHGCNAIHHTIGNWLSCFSCSPTQDNDSDVTEIPPTTIKTDGGNGSGRADKLAIDRVSMSKKIKSAIEVMHSKCVPVSDLLKITSHRSTTSTTINLKRPLVGSTSVQDKLYGRDEIFEKTIKDITDGACHGETLSVLPIVGPGGIGKTTFTQHLYNDKRTKEHFSVRVWVCVSTDFDVLKLTQQIHGCIPAAEKEENNITSAMTNLDQLQIAIADRLKSKRFLIVFDDIWKCNSDDEWKTLLAPFMKGEAKGSMVLVTTRFPKIEKMVQKATIPIHLPGLDPDKFFEFFQACVFGENKPDSELVDIGREIAEKLKCFPLAAKTVARLLRNHLSWERWREVLENNEWQNETNGEDIMPALKISYDFLPFHLKRCFSYLSLFPEDHRFRAIEINRLWTALGIIDSSCKNKNLEELVDNGFLMKECDDQEDQCYVMHDLLHELSQIVSSQECANISSLSFSADEIPLSIRHLSITIEDRYDENFRLEMAKLKSRIDIRKLRTLMIFRKYEERICEILKDTFNEIESLRVLFVVTRSPDFLPKNFSKLLHLRYLKLVSFSYLQISLPSELSRFYHLIFLDLEEWKGSSVLPKSISHLVNLRHFIANRELHSNVPEVGKIEHLEELKEFHIQKESVGFELEELGKLSNLGGKLRVCNLEKVPTKEEASKAKLALKRNLKILTLVWGTEQRGADADVIDGLQPHDSLRELVIKDGGGAIGLPSWLFRDVPITHLEYLTLFGMSWVTLPPFGQLPYLKKLVLKNIARLRFIGPDFGTGQCFMHLKEVEISYMPVLETWTLEPTCYLFPVLESIACWDCPNLLALPFWPDCSLSCTQGIHCPSLHSLEINECPKLFLPLMPPAPSLTSIDLSDDVQRVSLKKNVLDLRSYSGAVAFHNMSNIVSLRSEKGSITSWTYPEKATSLRVLDIHEHSSIESLAFISGLTSLNSLSLINCKKIAVDELIPVITGLTSLTCLKLVNCKNIAAAEFYPLTTAVSLKELTVHNGVSYPVSVAVHLLSEVATRTKQLPAGSFQLEKLQVDSIGGVLVAPICSLLAATLHELIFNKDRRVTSLTEDEEKALQLLTSLQTLEFSECYNLSSLPQGLHSLSSLRNLSVSTCYGIRSLPKGGLPASLYVFRCSSANLREQVRKLKGTNPELRVID